jgi:PAS domain S-box-containing protein
MSAAGSPRVLVVDDETGIRDGCRRVLTSEGWAVDTAPDGAAGLELAKRDHYDLLLIDLCMPGLSGLELLDALHEVDAAVVAVIITAYASLDTAVEATKRGAYDYLAKPFTPDELMAVVTRAWRHHLALEEAAQLRDLREYDMLALASEKSRLHTIIACMTDGLVVINRDRQVVLTNPAALRLLRKDELPVGEPVAECVGDRDLVELIVNALAAGVGTRLSRELVRGVGEDQTVMMATAASVVDEAGEGLGVIVVVRDVTALKQVERVKASFVNMVAHELRAPLGAVRGYLDILLDGMTSGDPDRERHMLARMRARTDGLLDLVADLLTMSRMDRARVSRTVERVELEEVLREVVGLFAGEAASRGITITYKPLADSLSVMADREELCRVFTNLISNAIKYNRQGGAVTISSDVVGEQARVAVADTGMGIPAEAVAKLGKEFFRVKNAQTREIVGTGLGLSVVRAILEAHHGRLEIASKEGVGSTFTVLLRRIDGQRAGAPSGGDGGL